MTNLKSIFKEYYVPPDVLGSGKRLRADELRVQLATHNRHLTALFWLAAAMIIAVFVIGIVIVVYFLNSPQVTTSVFGAMGVSVGGAITFMLRLAQELAWTRLTIILCGQLQNDRIAEIITVLVNKL
jgi:hypothetical protein